MVNINNLVQEVVEGLGYELVDFETSPKMTLLRVFIDIDRGITVDDCETVSNQLTRVFDVENVNYERLEVSSPGLDRPLKKLADFERFVGSDIQLRISQAINNQRNFIGKIKQVVEQDILIETEKDTIAIAISNVEKARLIPQF